MEAPFTINLVAPPENSIFKGKCPRCGFAASFRSQSSQVVATSGQKADHLFQFTAVCLHCGQHLLVDAKPYKQEIVAVYPPSLRAFPFGREHVEEVLLTMLDEVYRAFAAGCFTLAGIGCRVVLERLVQGKGHREVDHLGLEVRLEKLKDTYPDLVAPLVNADIVRKVGNAAAHDAFRDLTHDQCLATIEFTEDILRAVYVAPKKRQAMAAAFPK